jgi:hypothetical protein
MQPGMDPKAPAGRGGVSRAALLGLSGGMMLGGLFLLIQGLRTRLAPADCAGLSEMECGFMRDTAIEVGRTQSVAGAALLALAVAVVVLMRSRSRPGAW